MSQISKALILFSTSTPYTLGLDDSLNGLNTEKQVESTQHMDLM